jgi:hypothetical protein
MIVAKQYLVARKVKWGKYVGPGESTLRVNHFSPKEVIYSKYHST